MDNDDRPVGRILNRREVLALMGAAGAALLVGCLPGSQTPQATATTTEGATSTATRVPTATSTSTAGAAATSTATQATSAQATGTVTAVTEAAATMPSCVVSPELTEGPYFVDEMLNRSDIRSDPSDGSVKEGMPLEITMLVSQVGSGCTPLAGAQVDIWHCDALGDYSDTQDPNWNTVGQKFLRGYQVTDSSGMVKFTTIYPGWYRGRAVHIHFKIRTNPGSNQGYEFTSQFFFDDTLTDQVHTQEPYASKGQRDLRNSGDGIYQQSGGQTLLTLVQSGDGYKTTFDIGMQI